MSIATQTEDLRIRTHRRREIQQQETSRVIGDLNAAVGIRAVATCYASPLLAALAPIGNRIGVTFRMPNESGVASEVETSSPLGTSASESAPPTADESFDQIELIARASRVRTRRVRLRGNWWQEDGGDLLAMYTGGRPAALLRSSHGTYELYDPQDGSQRRVDRALAAEIAADAISLCRPLPDKTRSLLELGGFVFASRGSDILVVLALSLAATILGMFTAQATRILVESVIPNASSAHAVQLALGLLVTAIGIAMFHICRGLVTLRLQTSATFDAQAAIWDRLLNLSPTFFRQFSAGDLVNRVMMVTNVSREITATMLASLMTGLVAGANVILLFYYSPSLAWIAVLIAAAWSGVTIPLALALRSKSLQHERMSGRLFGFVVQLLGGMSRIRVAAAEQHAFNEWGRRFAGQLRLSADIARLQDIGRLIHFATPAISSILLFWVSSSAFPISSSDSGSSWMGTFLAFHVAFGIFISGITTAGNTLVDVVDSCAKGRLIRPLLEAVPEVDVTKVDPGRLEGGLVLRDVSFRYQPGGRLVLRGADIEARPGEFVAIVGASGSGKSTILRLLLGFETPESGMIAVDDQDLAMLDVAAVRRQMGVVLQKDRLSIGSIFENISLGCRATLDQAWQAARDVGLAEDIEQMPMGMHSIVNEGGSNLSGGQRQRVLLARAMVRNPRILLLDEATSALDNRTQTIVSRSIAARNMTRITVAHRLSTIEQADRIYVLHDGRVVQSGTFEQLSKIRGEFQDLLQRQALI